MNQQEAKRIVMTKFQGPAEQMAYCIHCLTPMNPWDSKLEEKGAGYPMEHAESRSWLLYRALEGRYVSPGSILDRKTHICEEECSFAKNHSVNNNPILKHPEALCWKAFQEPEVARALFCPTCYLPIHPGEGPFNAQGYRAELLRRLFPNEFKVDSDLFNNQE